MSERDGWKKVKLKYLGRVPLMYGANEPAIEQNLSDPRFIRITDVTSNGDLRPETYRSLNRSKAEPYLLTEGDLLLARSGATVGKTFYYRKSWGTCCFAGYLIRFRPNKNLIQPRFIWWYTKSSLWDNELGAATIQSTIQNVSAERYSDFCSPIPSLTTQQAIADYLDRKTAAIDGVIEKKERLLKVLAQKRQALITQAVTKGLNPDAPMKDSGIPWLGQIPAHWKFNPLKRAADLYRGKFTHRPRNDPKFYDGPYPFVQTGDVSRSNGYVITYNQTLNADGLKISKMFPSGTVVMVITGAKTGAVAVLGFDACFPDSCIGFAPKKNMLDSDYLLFLLDSLYTELRASAIMTTQENLNIERVSSIAIPIPPIDEQKRITGKVAEQHMASQRLATKLQEQIAKLKEYRQALITAAVTGQLDLSQEDSGTPATQEAIPG